MSEVLVPVEDHLARVLNTVVPLAPLELGLAESHGSYLAEDVTTPIPLPPFDNSSMDGYAVRLQDVFGARPERPVVLPVVGDVAAGSTAAITLQPGLAVRIMTGAPTPPGTEAVIPVEWTDGGAHEVAVHKVPQRGAYIRQAGEELAAGAPVLPAGTYLGSAQLGVLAAVGRQRVFVRPRPRVVVISTGSELTDVGTLLGPGQVYDANSYALAAACREAGATPYRVGIVDDDPTRLTEVLEDHLIQADVIVTSGGVSVGAYDIVKQVLRKVSDVQFARVAMQPGMPQGFGTLGPDAVPLFALPGNPVSSLVSFEVFVRPALRRLLGVEQLQRPRVTAAISTEWRSPEGKAQYVRVQVGRMTSGGFTARPVGGPGSHLIASMASANGLLVVAPGTTLVEKGTPCSVIVLDRRGP